MLYRIRRVKCDEGKPACNRCISTGRTCDGYSMGLTKPQETPKQFALTIESRSIEFFFDRVSPRISSLFEDDSLWKRIITQLTDLAVWNAVLATSAIFEQSENTKGKPVHENSLFAVESYNKAIQHLVISSSGDQHIRSVLLTCILFICIEFMRGDIVAAQRHIRSGSSILESFVPSSPSNYTLSIPGSRTLDDDFAYDIVAIMSRLRLQSALFQPNYYFPLDYPLASNEIFSSLGEARQSMYITSRETKDLVLAATQLKYSGSIFLDEFCTQARLQSQIQQWRISFKKLFNSKSSVWSQRERDAANVLLIQHLTSKIQIITALNPSESANDALRTEFETMIDLSTSVVNNNREVLNFHFDMGIIPCLHYIGIKCRYPILRRQILRILGSRRWREGMFDSHRSFRYVHKVMLAEEAAMPPATEFQMEALLLGSSNKDRLPPEESRVHYAILGPLEPKSTKQQVSLVFLPTHSHHRMIKVLDWIPTDGELPEVPPWID